MALWLLALVVGGAVSAAADSLPVSDIESHLARLNAVKMGCQPQCPGIKYKQRKAAALAISMVLYVNCEGNVQQAAKAIVAAAAGGQRDAFSAGFTTAMANLASGAPDQLVDTLTESFTVADSSKKTMGVAAGIADAVGKMQGSQLVDVLTKVVMALNNLATKAKCKLASDVSEGFLYSLIKLNGFAAKTYLSIAMNTGTSCYSRRLKRVADSTLVKVPIAVSPCTRAMQEASAVSVSMITASTCNSTPDRVQSTASAMVTAAVNNGCAFASAVTAASIWGLPEEALVNVFTAAITKAKVAKKQADVSAAFAAAYAEVVYANSGDASGESDQFLKGVLRAAGSAIDVSGCKKTESFIKGMYKNMVALVPQNKQEIRKCFLDVPQIVSCKCLDKLP